MFPLAPEGRKRYQFEKVLVNTAALGKVLLFSWMCLTSWDLFSEVNS